MARTLLLAVCTLSTLASAPDAQIGAEALFSKFPTARWPKAALHVPMSMQTVSSAGTHRSRQTAATCGLLGVRPALGLPVPITANASAAACHEWIVEGAQSLEAPVRPGNNLDG
jgi:hypothetical protein